MKSFKILILLLGIYNFVIYACTKKDVNDNETIEYFPRANQIDSIVHDGDLRTFKLHVPDSYSENNKTALIIAFHGYGNTAEEMEQTSNLSEKSDQEVFIVAYPNGKDYPKDNNSTQYWNANEYYKDLTGNTDDVGFISKMIDLISKYYAIDEDRIFVTGFSNGGHMSYKIGYELSCKIAAIAPHSGLLSFNINSAPDCKVPIIHIHGLGDGIVSYSESSVDNVLCIWNNWDNCNQSPDTTFENDDYLIKQWSSSGNILYLSKEGRHSWCTTSKAGFNATDVMWEFFKANPKNN